jgi:hypothetical protein
VFLCNNGLILTKVFWQKRDARFVERIVQFGLYYFVSAKFRHATAAQFLFCHLITLGVNHAMR